MRLNWRLGGVISLVFLLSACASTVTTQVVAFHDNGAFHGARTYAFKRTPEQDNNLEQKTYEGWVRDRLAGDGFQERAARDAQYLVSLAYGMQSSVVRVQEPAFDPMFGPGWYGPWGWRYNPWMWGPPPMYVERDWPVYMKWLQLRFLDRASGREVYLVSARTEDGGNSLVGVMPYLIRAALAKLPFPSGQQSTVEEKVAPSK